MESRLTDDIVQTTNPAEAAALPEENGRWPRVVADVEMMQHFAALAKLNGTAIRFPTALTTRGIDAGYRATVLQTALETLSNYEALAKETNVAPWKPEPFFAHAHLARAEASMSEQYRTLAQNMAEALGAYFDQTMC